MIYFKLAHVNLKKNRKTYFPYILTCVLTIMMFYIMLAISQNKGFSNMAGGASLKIILDYSSGITGIFSAVFLFYTNSFLVKQRKKEFGLYQVLGMDKRNLTKMMIWETLITMFVSFAAGLFLGVILGKLMFLILLKILNMPSPFEFALEPEAMAITVALFLGVFFVTLLANLRQVHKANPIELLQGGHTGEQEPKTKWVLALIGVITLGGGYFIAQTTDRPIDAIGKFFIAVILVIIGTYCLFTAGSIALLKMLKKRKNFYYQTRHFTSVSGMIYRMKQNAVGLANICIMSTIVLVLISVTVSLYVGMEDVLATRFPTEFRFEITDTSTENLKKDEQIIKEETAKADVKAVDKGEYRYAGLTAVYDREQATLTMKKARDYTAADYCALEVIPLTDFNELEGRKETLNEKEIFVCTPDEKFESDTLTLDGEVYQVKRVFQETKAEKNRNSASVPMIYIIMSSEEEPVRLQEKYGAEGNQVLHCTGFFNLSGEEDAKLTAMEAMQSRIEAEVNESYTEYREEARESFYTLYGGFFFMGVFVGSLFLMATVLIIYYKQISEGYDDRERFQIMQKVGMSEREVKKTIHSQVLLVFFLPLALAVVHVAFAFKTITKLLAALNLTNIHLFFLCTVGTVMIFAVLYGAVYGVTSKVYYRIVR